MNPFVQRGVHLGLTLPLIFLLFPASKRSPKDRVTLLDGVLAVLAFLPPLYTVLHSDTLLRREPYFTTPIQDIELFLGGLLIILVIEGSRRAVNLFFAGLITLLLVFLMAGPLLPGVLWHRGLRPAHVIEASYLFSSEGINGSLMGLSATIIIVFVIFGAIIQSVGTGEAFMNLARSIAGRSVGGPAKVSAITSALFGTMSGSSIANVYTTGVFTIPLMKKVGYSPRFAGALEAAASTGGQYMPPVMGVGAWVIAQNLQMPYWDVAVRAIVPAALFYAGLYFMIHFHAVKYGLRGTGDQPSWRETASKLHMILPVGLLFALLSSGYSPMYSVFYTTVVAYLLGLLRRETRRGPLAVMHALTAAVKSMLLIVVAIAGVSLMVVALTYSGLGPALASSVLSVAGDNLFLALLMIAVAAIILGVGIPTVASYVIVSAVGALALIELGADPFAAHLFIFYFAVISNITPPVAMAAFAGASVALSDPMKTGLEAFKIAIAGYLIPFAFVFSPILLHGGPLWTMIGAIVSALLGVIALAGSVQGWVLGRDRTAFARLLLFCAGVLLILPDSLSNWVGVGMGLLALTNIGSLRREVDVERNDGDVYVSDKRVES